MDAKTIETLLTRIFAAALDLEIDKTIFRGFLPDPVNDALGVIVESFANGNEVTAVFRYENYDVTGLYSATGGQYYIARCAEKSTKSFSGFEGDSFRKEFAEFYELLKHVHHTQYLLQPKSVP